MRVTALLFDVDGLLFDSEKIYFRFWKKAGMDLGYSLSDETVLSLRSCDYSIARRIVNESAGDDTAYDKVRARRKELMKSYSKNVIPDIKPGIVEFLQMINNDNQLKKVIVTQSSREEKVDLLKRSGLLDYFDDIVSAENVKKGKPFPDVYIFACKLLSVDPCSCIAFEDSPNGVISASDAGVNVVMIPDLTYPDKALSDRCVAVFNNIIDACPMVKDSI